MHGDAQLEDEEDKDEIEIREKDNVK